MRRTRVRAASRDLLATTLVAAGALLAGCGVPAGPAPQAPRPRPGAEVALPTPPPPFQREFRGVWIATVNNIDWPTKRGLSTDSMKAELLALIEGAARLHMNAIVFQVRPAADALYRSSIEPWSPFLTGTMGKDPGFDPLAFVIREAHARGIQVHAWFNPYRAGFVNPRWQASPEHVSRKHPDWVVRYGSFYWMDPGNPKVLQYSLSVIADVARRYDVDGIHIDDYFYPYVERDSATKQPIPFPDDASYAAYRAAGGTLDRGDWRRDNVNRLLQGMDSTVHAIKPWVLVGVSPIGVYRPGIPSGGFDAYSEIYCDSKKWINDGWVDYYAPQVYWTTNSSNPYAPVLKWWADENTDHRHLWPGNFTTRAGTSGAWTVGEIVKQIDLTREQQGASGNIHFSGKFLYGTTPVGQALLDGPYADEALVPASPWLGDAAPAAPRLELQEHGGRAIVRLAPGDATPVRVWAIRYYDGTRWFQAVLGGEASRFELPDGLQRPFWVAVSAVGRTGVEGPLATAEQK